MRRDTDSKGLFKAIWKHTTTSEAMREVEIESSYNGKDNTPTRHFMSLSKSLSSRNGLHLVESLDKEVP